jgi:hypothetical protein
MKDTIATSTLNHYGKVYRLEFGIDAKAFCNYFSRYYYAGEAGTAMNLIRAKHMVSSIDLKLNVSSNHQLTMNIASQNDLKKGVGINALKISDIYRVNDKINLKNSLNFKPESCTWTPTLTYKITPAFVLQLSN